MGAIPIEGFGNVAGAAVVDEADGDGFAEVDDGCRGDEVDGQGCGLRADGELVALLGVGAVVVGAYRDGIGAGDGLFQAMTPLASMSMPVGASVRL